jgi:TfoX N-terminal domain
MPPGQALCGHVWLSDRDRWLPVRLQLGYPGHPALPGEMTWPTTKPSQPGIREIIDGIDGEVAERKMFGGLAFMLNGHMFTGIVGDELILRRGGAAP